LHTRFPKATIIPALGNHDSHPADFFADPAIDSASAKRIYSGYIEQGSLGDLLRDFPEAKSKFKECGYYSVKQKNYFKVIYHCYEFCYKGKFDSEFFFLFLSNDAANFDFLSL
jgi:hypothetical protein